MDEDETLTIALEITSAGPLELHISPVALFQIVSVLQLAMRHPGFQQSGGDAYRSAVWFVENARAHFSECPGVLELLRMGDDPAHDRPF